MVKFKEKAEIFLRFRLSTSPCNVFTRGIQIHTAAVPARTMAACLPVCCSLNNASAFFWQVKSGRLLFLRETDRRKVFWWRAAPACMQNAIIHNNGAVHTMHGASLARQSFSKGFWMDRGKYQGFIWVPCLFTVICPVQIVPHKTSNGEKRAHVLVALNRRPDDNPTAYGRAALLMCWPNIDFGH